MAVTISEQMAASTISGQVELAWRDAWRHEMRDRHGRWTRGGTADITGKFDEAERGGRKPVTVKDILAEWRKSKNDLARPHLNRAAAALDAGDRDAAVDELRKASAYAGIRGEDETGDRLHQLAASLSDESRTNAAVADFASRGAKAVTGLLGAGHNGWNGKVDLFNAEDRPAIAASLNWDGTMAFQRELAQKMRDDKGGRVDAQPYVTALHELIHGALPEGQAHAVHSKAYQDPTVASVEEGFTELGTVHHAPEFFRKMGMGGRETGVLSVDKAGHARESLDVTGAKMAGMQADVAGLLERAQTASRSARAWLELRQAQGALASPGGADVGAVIDHLSKAAAVAGDEGLRSDLNKLMQDIDVIPGTVRHATVEEYAKRIRDPERIAKGDAWGHYGWQTAAAQSWVQDAAKAEGKGPKSPRVREMADEINREGVGGKVAAMARQVIRAAGGDPDTFQGVPFVALEARIQEQWPQGPAEAQASPWASALAAAKDYVRSRP